MRQSRARWVWPVAFAVLVVAAVGCGASKADGKAGDGAGDSAVAAQIGDQVITNAELDEEVRKNDAKAFQAYYDARRKVLDQMIAKRLIDAELASRGVTEPELQQELTANVAQVSESEIQAFYAQNSARMGGKPIEEMSPQIGQFLGQQRKAQVMTDFLSELKKKSSVHVYLDPPRSEVKIAANDPRKGPEGAPITLVEFSDFQ